MTRGFKVCSAFTVALLLIAATSLFTAQTQAADWKADQTDPVHRPPTPRAGEATSSPRSIAKIVETEKLSPQPLIVTNMPAGGGTTIGTTSRFPGQGERPHAAHLHLGQVTAPMTVGTTAATYRDLTMISALALDEQCLAVRKDFPFATMKDIVEELKKKPNSLVVGGGGMGGEDQMCNRLLEKANGREAPLRLLSTAAGSASPRFWANTWTWCGSTPPSSCPSTTPRRSASWAWRAKRECPIFRRSPTFRDSGYDVTFDFFRGIAAPPGIPADAVAFYVNMMKQVSDSRCGRRTTSSGTC